MQAVNSAWQLDAFAYFTPRQQVLSSSFRVPGICSIQARRLITRPPRTRPPRRPRPCILSQGRNRLLHTHPPAGGGGGEKFNRRSQEAHPTRCRVEPARVSSPQVDLTRYGLDKTPTLLILRCLGVDPLRPKGKEVPATDARPRWQSRGEARRSPNCDQF